jgi:hypothetical protein
MKPRDVPDIWCGRKGCGFLLLKPRSCKYHGAQPLVMSAKKDIPNELDHIKLFFNGRKQSFN